MVMGSDIPQVVAEIAEYLRTPGISVESALSATHKYKMKQRFQERRVPVPWFSLVNSVDELELFVRERGYPLIIKPVDRSRSPGSISLNRRL